MSTLLTKYNALPRAAKWGLWSVGIVAAYFLAVEPALDATNKIRTHADALAASLADESRYTSTESQEGRDLENGRLSFGEPLLPQDPANKPEAIHKLVDSVLKNHGVTKASVSERTARMPTDEAAKLLGPDAATSFVTRLTLDITFEADPDTVTKILADLEQAREVAVITGVELRRPDAGTKNAPPSTARIIKATISPEAWIVQSAGATPGGVSR